MSTAKRVLVGGALLALLASGLGGFPAVADRDDPPAPERGILEHEVPIDVDLKYDVFYPEYDDYRDSLIVRFVEHPGTDERMRQITMKVYDAAGDQVIQLAGPDLWDLWREGSLEVPSWRSAYAPAGRYTLQVTIIDSTNDRKVVDLDFRLDRAHVQRHVWKRTFRAADTLIDKGVGRCAALRRPARRGWPGSLGYRSRCATGQQSVVATAHGVYLPKPFEDWHFDVRLTMHGGRAQGSGGSQLGYTYLNTSGDWVRRREFGSRVGVHRGFKGWGGRFVQGQGTRKRPHFIWSVGLAEGQKYDVKSFTVATTYLVLK